MRLGEKGQLVVPSNIGQGAKGWRERYCRFEASEGIVKDGSRQD
jgi:hypothetical protein